MLHDAQRRVCAWRLDLLLRLWHDRDALRIPLCLDLAVLHRLQVQARAPGGGGKHDGARDERDCWGGAGDGVDGDAGACDLHRHHLGVLVRQDVGAHGPVRRAVRGAVRHGGCHHGHALHCRLCAGDGHLRPHCRQRRRHRRDVAAACAGARHHGPARQRRQHHQGHHQGLCHRLRRPRLLPPLQRVHGRGVIVHGEAVCDG
mmetsp:Transcript_45308/g.92516  ORF Transcript_45308/g.92516 Transcript_45308/m.92516 type:complete len:202 (+) Transcript_45308:424-1029(+)